MNNGYMKKIIRALNFILFSLYRWDLIATSVIEYIISFKWIKYLQFNRRKYFDDRFYVVKSNSHLSILYAQNGFILTMSFAIYAVLNLVKMIIEVFLLENISHNSVLHFFLIILAVISSILISSQVILKNKKYLVYFDEFEKLPSRQRKINHLISFLVIVFVVVMAFLIFLISLG